MKVMDQKTLVKRGLLLSRARSTRARPFAFNHLETFVWFWFDYFT